MGWSLIYNKRRKKKKKEGQRGDIHIGTIDRTSVQQSGHQEGSVKRRLKRKKKRKRRKKKKVEEKGRREEAHMVRTAESSARPFNNEVIGRVVCNVCVEKKVVKKQEKEEEEKKKKKESKRGEGRGIHRRRLSTTHPLNNQTIGRAVCNVCVHKSSETV